MVDAVKQPRTTTRAKTEAAGRVYSSSIPRRVLYIPSLHIPSAAVIFLSFFLSTCKCTFVVLTVADVADADDVTSGWMRRAHLIWCR